MFARKERTAEELNAMGELPISLMTEIKNILNSTYEKELQTQKREFSLRSEIFADELLLIVSAIGQRKEKRGILPYTLFLSADLTSKENAEELKGIVDDFVDIVAMVFDDFFQNSEEAEYTNDWDDAILDENSYFYKISREDIEQSLLADKLLS